MNPVRTRLLALVWCLLGSLLLAAVVSAQTPPATGLVVKVGDRLAVAGDSITEQKLYSRYLELYLLACRPDLNTRVMQFGWGGERAAGFAARMANDLAGFQPTLVTTCYGMNDGSYTAYTEAIGKAYEIPMRDIVTRLKAQGVTVVVGSPGAVDTRYFRNDPGLAQVYNENLAQLTEIARKVAAEAGMPFADVHGAMRDAMTKAKAALGDDYDVCGRDGVHPNANGHLVMAYAFLKAMGFDGDLGTITVDLKGEATASEGHQVLSSHEGVVEIESSRYPFCFFGGEADSGGTRSILPFLPFNQDLNRLTLIVKNLETEQAEVTWGGATKTFARADLEKGINLAAEFLDNPFSVPFRQLESQVAAKQAFETYLIKSQVTQYPALKRLVNEDPQILALAEAFHKALWEYEARQQEQVRAALAPVKHTLTVKPAA